ncbi:MAG: hypothetical protein P1P90_02795 [Patescibacteria group bacterium]|nr:hypothetical protein [Patescibacteria group bacterium]
MNLSELLRFIDSQATILLIKQILQIKVKKDPPKKEGTNKVQIMVKELIHIYSTIVA